jgi:hyperosmotically inducible periplasmic protein
MRAVPRAAYRLECRHKALAHERPTMNHRSAYLLPAALASAFALAACGPRDENQTVGQTVGQKVDEAVAGAKAGADEAKKATADATITTKITAALAADDKLKATKIDVDTANGRVVLTGSAPDAGSKDRATTLAKAVEGVVDVDNRLSVEAKG